MTKEMLEKYDANGNGVIDQDELALIQLDRARREMEDEDARRDAMLRLETDDRSAQRKMAYFALFGLLLYPFGIFLSDALSMGKAAELIADIAPTYFASIAVLCSAFFGSSALKKNIEKK